MLMGAMVMGPLAGWVIKQFDKKVEGHIPAAFENPDGSHALVLLNDNETERQLEVNDGQQTFAYKVPAHAVVSFKWKK